jgi:hypothetical protein
MGSIDEDLDRKVSFLHIAQEAGLVLKRNGQKLRMKQAVEHEDPNLDVVFRLLGENKVDVLEIMEDGAAVREWLLAARREMTVMHNKLNETMDRWINIERMYVALNPDDEGCICRDECPDDQAVRCLWCAENRRSQGKAREL